MSVRPLLAIGLATAGISVAFAAPAAAAPGTSTNQHVVRDSAKAAPNGGYSGSASSTSNGSNAKSRKLSSQASSKASSSAQSSVPTSNKKVLSSDAGTPVAVKHHWGTHNRHHGIL
jgi:hypothetical protein